MEKVVGGRAARKEIEINLVVVVVVVVVVEEEEEGEEEEAPAGWRRWELIRRRWCKWMLHCRPTQFVLGLATLPWPPS